MFIAIYSSNKGFFFKPTTGKQTVGNEDEGVPVVDIRWDPDSMDHPLHLWMDVLGVEVGNEDKGILVVDILWDPMRWIVALRSWYVKALMKWWDLHTIVRCPHFPYALHDFWRWQCIVWLHDRFCAMHALFVHPGLLFIKVATISSIFFDFDAFVEICMESYFTISLESFFLFKNSSWTVMDRFLLFSLRFVTMKMMPTVSALFKTLEHLIEGKRGRCFKCRDLKMQAQMLCKLM